MKESELHVIIFNEKSKALIDTHRDTPQDKSYFENLSPLKFSILVDLSLQIPVKNKIYFSESIFSAVFWGVANFIFSLLDDTDFATSCLTFPGFLTICIGYKILQIREHQRISKKIIFEQFFSKYFDETGSRVNFFNIFHMIIRSCLFFGLSLLVILASGYAQKAKINFGIVTSCISFSIVLSSIFSYIYYDEKLTKTQIIGMIIIIISIVGISFSKGNKSIDQADNRFTEEEKQYYKIISIALALTCGFVNFLRTFQAKYIYKKNGYQPVDLSVDCGLFLGLMTMICSIYYWLTGCKSYTWYNFGINIIASHIMMVLSIVALKCLVKGLAGPTGAIMYTCPVYTSILAAIFLKQIPSIYQIIASLLAILGVAIIILGSSKQR
ncbi:UNKNOWN [Stylonychia lemnae]|uniref:EamA domain-containing protein n=1 Tax=Stylonychia lemnae TaxID=5949 RepID=A0A078B8U1_STYLE|nr:UNKNOWN [Stylonychia lemnae]|eukprot:CDW89958.1 UNKNOWN [Stylonychia lemnae]